MTRNWLWVVLLPTLICNAQEKLPLPALDPMLKKELTTYLNDHRLSPEDYVISKFKDHDVIFLGENHRIKENVELVQHLIALLYKNGVHTLCTEFARREDQPLLDSLLNAPKYSESLAREITFRSLVFWGFQEYVDIFEAAWELNQSLRPAEPRFRILGLHDSPDWSLIKTEADRDNPEIKRKVWRGGGEHIWARVVLDSVVARGEKALVYCGLHHAFSEYKQPIYDNDAQKFLRFEDERMGNFVYREIGKRVITVCMHAPWISAKGYGAPATYPVDGAIDALMVELGPTAYPIGFDTKGTPFGMLTDTGSVYHHGYEPFTLEQFVDGYIFQVPLSQYKGVTPIADFVNSSNVDYARQQSPSPQVRDWTVEQFNEAIAEDANMPRRLSHLH